FSRYESLGSTALECADIDGDGVGDFMLVGRLAGPRYRFLSGGAYLIFGRKKTPFPPDINGDGLPDITDPNGAVVPYPTPPTYVTNPYDSANVGRFGGKISVNSVGGFFRGATYGMPQPHLDFDGPQSEWYNFPPATLMDPNGYGGDPNAPEIYTAGLTSVTRVNMVWGAEGNTGVPDFVFGLPFVSSAYDHIDADPADGCGSQVVLYEDLMPGIWSDPTSDGPDDLISPRNPPSPYGENTIGQGLVIVVDGTNNLTTLFGAGYIDAGMAGQHDPDGVFDDEGVIWNPGQAPDGMRFRGAYWDTEVTVKPDPNNPLSWYMTPYDRKPLDPNYPLLLGNAVFYSDSEFGRTVNRMPNFDNNPGDELLISSPGYSPFLEGYPSDPWGADTDLHRGRVQVWMSAGNYSDSGWYGQNIASMPAISACPTACDNTDPNNPIPFRCSIPQPIHADILGEEPGDRFGFAAPAGDFNQDGVEDIIAGAPGATRNGKTHCGVVYLFACARGGFGDIDLADPAQRPRQVQIIGSHANDQFGLVQTGIRDVDQDGKQDVAIGSEFYNNNAGFVGVIFGDRPITGEHGFAPESIGTANLPGVRFLGTHPGDRAGHDVASAGDFNGDGVGDLLITAPGETRVVNGQTHKGVAYLIFGGRHLRPYDPNDPSYNMSFTLDQVGTTALPGIVFIGRLQEGLTSGTNDHPVPLEIARGIGDIDDDGFDDIMIGAPTADFVFGASPDQRVPQAGEAYIVYGSNYGTNKLH
ncbi:MAG TPA: integrin alpha, partial [Phycisphaerae bacterium]|nr:integrin alpha [Phycisphaerae bacterium]